MYKPWTRFAKVVFHKLVFLQLFLQVITKVKNKMYLTVFWFWQVLGYNVFQIERCLSSSTLSFFTFLLFIFFISCNTLIDIFMKFSCYFSLVLLFMPFSFNYALNTHTLLTCLSQHKCNAVREKENEAYYFLLNPSPAPLRPRHLLQI